jgi:hypothetical protein
MYGTTQSCPGGSYPDTSIVLHREHEAGFLLPQFMGALASETSGLGMTDMCQPQLGEGLFSRLCASLMHSLKLRSLFLK